MIQIAFTEAEIAALDYERYRHPRAHVQKRKSLPQKSSCAPKDCAPCAHVRQTVVTHLAFVSGRSIGTTTFSTLRATQCAHQHQSRLRHTSVPPPRTVAEAQATIEHLDRHSRSPTRSGPFSRASDAGAQSRSMPVGRRTPSSSRSRTPSAHRARRVMCAHAPIFLSTAPLRHGPS